MPLLVGAGRPNFGRWRRVGRYSSGSAPANQAIAAGAFTNFETVGVPASALQQNQALLLKRYLCSISDPGNSDSIFLAQPPQMTLQVNPFGLNNSVLTFSSNVQGGVGTAGNPNYGRLSAIGTNFVLENEWLEFDDYKTSLSVFTTLTTPLMLQALKLFTDCRFWNAAGAGGNVRFSESLAYEIWQQNFSETPT